MFVSEIETHFKVYLKPGNWQQTDDGISPYTSSSDITRNTYFNGASGAFMHCMSRCKSSPQFISNVRLCCLITKCNLHCCPFSNIQRSYFTAQLLGCTYFELQVPFYIDCICSPSFAWATWRYATCSPSSLRVALSLYAPHVLGRHGLKPWLFPRSTETLLNKHSSLYVS